LRKRRTLQQLSRFLSELVEVLTGRMRSVGNHLTSPVEETAIAFVRRSGFLGGKFHRVGVASVLRISASGRRLIQVCRLAFQNDSVVIVVSVSAPPTMTFPSLASFPTFPVFFRHDVLLDYYCLSLRMNEKKFWFSAQRRAPKSAHHM
jgi:hypothetical protein